MERLGIPSTLVMTEPFVRLAANFGRTLDMPGYPAVVVPHPIASLSDAELATVADAAVDVAAARLTQST